ncbi:hypothetical protein BHE74_00042600 [Ensete ventricosum]|nr:hypothetical protein GW17_00012242 [Ensete ventricosum]RWW51088.1 hypothetical protein BHE74_00042600 [Ensete ventricosum]
MEMEGRGGIGGRGKRGEVRHGGSFHHRSGNVPTRQREVDNEKRGNRLFPRYISASPHDSPPGCTSPDFPSGVMSLHTYRSTLETSTHHTVKTSAPNTMVFMNKIANGTASGHGCNLLPLLHKVRHGTERRGRAREKGRKGIGARTATPQISHLSGNRRPETHRWRSHDHRQPRGEGVGIASGRERRARLGVLNGWVGSSGFCSIEMRVVT